MANKIVNISNKSNISKTRRMAIANGTCVSFCTFWPPLGTPIGQSR